MRTVQRLVSIALLAILAASVSGCVVRPLWWGERGGYGHDRAGYGDRGDHGERGGYGDHGGYGRGDQGGR